MSSDDDGGEEDDRRETDVLDLGSGAAAANVRALFLSKEYPVVATDAEGIITAWGAGAQALLGFAADEVVGTSLHQLAGDKARELSEIWSRLEPSESLELELQLRCKDGLSATALVIVSVADATFGPKRVTVFLKDVSEVRRVDRRLQALGRTEMVARQAVSVVQEMNNLLTIATAHQGFVAEGPLSESQAADLDVARGALDSVAHLVDHLIGLSRPRGISLLRFDLNEVARAAERLLHRLVGSKIKLLVRVSSSPLRVRAGDGQLEQIITNLVLNARDAMPAGGTLTVSVRNAAIGAGHPLSSEMAHGPYAVLSVKDTGVGMQPALVRQIFEPFYSTKPSAEGAGLGLAVLRDIVSQLKGTVRVNSELGQGSMFNVYLPLFEPAERHEPAPQPLANDRKTILVVDPNVAIRSAIQRMLSADLTVLLAADWADAALVANGYEGEIDLLLADLELSKVDEVQTVMALRAARPMLRTLFLAEAGDDTSSLELGAATIKKPFSQESVVEAVYRALHMVPISLRPAGGRPAVLIVDDNVDFSDSLIEELAQSELRLFAAKSGLHAIQVLEEHHIDLVVSDQMMPGMDGIKLLEVVRHRWPRCHRVLLTGHPSADVVLGAVNRGGAVKVLTKSMHPVVIRDEIAREALATYSSQPR